MDGQNGDYSIRDNLTAVIQKLKANRIKYAVVMIGFWDASTSTIEYVYSPAFMRSICAAFQNNGIKCIAWGESYPGHGTGTPDLTKPAQIAGMNAAVTSLMALGFDGYTEDLEIFTGTWTDWVAYHNQQATMLHALGKLAMPGVPMDWRQDLNPYLHVDFILSMFYSDVSNLEQPNCDAWFQENFGQWYQNKPPASPLIFGILNMPKNTQPLSWQLAQFKRCVETYGAPNLAGILLYNYEYMGVVNPTDWQDWLNFVNAESPIPQQPPSGGTPWKAVAIGGAIFVGLAWLASKLGKKR
jgi:hypothetical protein